MKELEKLLTEGVPPDHVIIVCPQQGERYLTKVEAENLRAILEARLPGRTVIVFGSPVNVTTLAELIAKEGSNGNEQDTESKP